jgi:hypothetical protein
MKKLLIISLFGFITSCTNTVENNISPYQQYKQFLTSLKVKNYEDALHMLSPYNQTRFHKDKADEGFNEFFPFFSSVDSVVVKEIRYYEKVKDEKSCLTISGYNKEGDPTSLNFLLLNVDGYWKLHYVHMAYHETKSEFPDKATCPVIP